MKSFIIILFVFINSISIGQVDRKIDLTEFIREVQIVDKDDTNISIAWWLPNCYWRIALADNEQIPQETITQIEDTYKDYLFLCSANIQIHLNGTMTFIEEDELREFLSIADKNGKIYYPLENDLLSDDLKLFNEMMKPMFAQMLGQLGEGMHFYFFEIKDKKGNNVINENMNDDFIVKHSNKEFKFNLPLVTLMEPKFCPIDSVEMKGNWMYCPYHGTKLINKK